MRMLLAPRRIAVLVVFIGLVVFLAWFLPQTLNPVKKSREARDAERRWVNTSPYWLDRQACRWLSLCGLMHVKTDPPGSKEEDDDDDESDGHHGHELRRRDASQQIKEEARQRVLVPPIENDAPERGADGENNEDKTHGLRGIPDYVLDYAPLVHLYSEEFFWPADIADHIKHMEPYANEKRINLTAPLELANLHSLHDNHGDLFLRSKDDVEMRPPWLHNWDSVPASFSDGGRDEDHRPAVEIGSGHVPSEKTTWFDVDRDHPLRRISDPRKIPGSDKTNYAPVPKGRRGDLRRRREERRNLPLMGAAGAATAAAATNEGEENKPDESGYSPAPVTLVLVDKGSGIVDAFWFFFYAYNLGQSVLGVRYGNHVGDWEHAMVRFDSGVPRAVFLSEHEGGQTYAWHALEKRRGAPGSGFNSTTTTATDGEEADATAAAADEKLRPVLYSAVGSHAMYAMPGDHPYILPFNMLKDQTDRGPLWDPRKNFRAYWYDYTVEQEEDRGNTTAAASHADRGLAPVREQPDNPTGWFHYGGRWGDRVYGLDDRRQWRLFGQYHYVTGPEGPKSKNLGRERMCMRRGCRILQSIAEGRSTSWHS